MRGAATSRRRAGPCAKPAAVLARTVSALALTAVALLVATAGGCSKSPPRPRAEITCRVVAGEGGRPIGEMDIRTTTGLIDLELERLGFERRAVLPTADGRIRIVLAEAQIHRMDEVRALLAEPRLRVQIVE